MAQPGFARRTTLLVAAAIAVVAATAVLLAVAQTPASLPRHGHCARGAGRQPSAVGAEKPMHVGFSPGAMAITADGRTAYVVNSGQDNGHTVTPINLATGQPGRPIKVGKDPVAITITPNGRIAYVSNGLSDTITPIRIR